MDTTLRRSAAVCAAATGVLHLLLAHEYLHEKAYLGVLFALGGVALLCVTLVLLARHHPGAWTLGAVVCACMFIGFVLSRTVGLPRFREAEWEVSGLLSLVVEGVFTANAAIPARRRPAAVVVGAGEFMAYDALTPRGTSDHSVR